MAWIETSPKVNKDLDTFNYNTESEKIKRRRAAAQALQDQSMRSEQGQFIKNGDYMGFVGGNTGASTAARLLAAYMSKEANSGTDQSQAELDNTSMQALTYQLDNMPWEKRARIEQAAQNAIAEGDALDARNEPEAVSQNARATEPPAVEALPYRAPVLETRPLDHNVAASALSGASTNQTGMTPQQIEAAAMRSAASSQLSGQRRGSSGSLRRNAYVAGMDQPVPEMREAFATPAREGGAGGSWGEPEQPPVRAAATPPQAPQQSGLMPTFSGAPAAPQPAAVPQPQQAPIPVPPARGTATQAEQLAYIQRVAQTGPMGAQIAQQHLAAMFGGKGEYDVHPIKDKDTGDITAVLKFNKRTGAYQVDNLEGAGRTGSSKIIGTEVGKDGITYNRHKDGSVTPANDGGKPFVSAEGQKVQQEQEKAKASELAGINQMRVQRAQLQEAIPLIKEVGTGRLQTPWNNLKAYVTDSTKLDKMNRQFNAQQLQDAVTWLKGQGSVTEGERGLLAKGGFDPKASTQSNVDYANTVLGMLDKHLTLAEQEHEKKYGSTTAPSSGSSLADSMFPPRR